MLRLRRLTSLFVFPEALETKAFAAHEASKVYQSSAGTVNLVSGPQNLWIDSNDARISLQSFRKFH